MPLNSVLYPWMPVVLSIYEQRYLDMLEDCLASTRVFGMALIAEGREVGGPAVPHDVGTEAIIARAWPIDDGSWRVVGIGRHRFRVIEVVQQEPYPVAEVEYGGLDEHGQDDVPEELVQRVQTLFDEHVRLLLDLLNQPTREMTIPDEPARLSYMVAAHLGAGTVERQRLLEIPSARERLEAEIELLRQDLAKLRLFAAARPGDPRKARLN